MCYITFRLSNLSQASIGSGYLLNPTMCQINIWINDDQIHWRQNEPHTLVSQYFYFIEMPF